VNRGALIAAVIRNSIGVHSSIPSPLPNVPLEFIQQVFETMARCSQHTFQILTKRSERLRRLAPEIDWPSNVDMLEAMLHLMHLYPQPTRQ